jgi:cytochrome o ubiquinol oxidase subunit 2
MNRNYIAICVVAAVLAIVALIAYLHTVPIPVLQPKGPVAAGELSVIYLTLALSAIVVVPVFVMLFVFAWRYRASNPTTRRHHEPDWDHYNTVAEIVWWLVPAMIVAALSVVAWQSAHALDPYVPLQGSGTPITVEVVALDWKWLFIYPESGVASVNMLEIPQGSPIHFELTADAPMNSFWIPALGGQIMAMPGMTTQLNLMATSLGDFNGFSANISGEGFAGMAFTARSVSQDDFNAWIKSIQASSTPLTMPAYDVLARPSTYDAPSYYSPVDPELYTDIVMKFMMPTSGMSGMPMSGMNMQ